MILAANRCRDRSPDFYVADGLSEIAGILNPKLGDVAMLVVGGATEFWRLEAPGASSDTLDTIPSNACEHSWVRSGSVINVKIFGAVGDGVTDDSAAIQAAIDSAYSIGPTPPPLYFPAGIYLIRTELNHTQNANYVQIFGDGIHQTYIRAGAAMPHLLKMGNSGNSFDGRNSITGITFDQNGLAVYGVDATEIRYSTITRNEFTNPPANGFNLKMGRWVNRVIDNLFSGGGVGGGMELSGTPFNNLVIFANSFSDCLVGIQSTASGVQDAHILCNTFDACTGTAIWFKWGCRNGIVRGNYFENCGKTGVSVERSAGVFETWKAAIVAHSLYNATSDTQVENMVVEDNFFANCAQESLLSLSNIIDIHVEHNHVLKGYSYDTFVNLRWQGALYTVAKSNYIEYTDFGATVTAPVGLNADNATQNHSGLQIICNTRTPPNRQASFDGVLGNPFNWDVFGTAGSPISIGHDGKYESLWQIWKFERAAGSDYFLHRDITIAALGSGLSGPRYLRLNWLTRGDVGAENGIRLGILINGVLTYNIAVTSETWTTGRGIVVMIPATAVSIEFVVTPAFSTNPCWVSKFSIIDAAFPMENEISLTDLEYRVSATPTYGTHIGGTSFRYKAPAAGTFIGVVCTTGGSPGTWRDYGAIQP